jgi:8-oxo-dGTP pyrophosphatase MutT (NUDIX family)
MLRNKLNCNNCGKFGHTFHYCKHPITSVGLIVYKPSADASGANEYLMICRKDTIGYIEFIRGKYALNNKAYIKNIISEMTLAEKKRILATDFNTLWKELWGDNVNNHYNEEQHSSKEKFESLKNGVTYLGEDYNLKILIDETNTAWEEAEWGFPKGRHNNNEKDLMCALREFEEETGYSRYSLKIVQNLMPFEEIFTGSNYKSYKHKYYIACIVPDNDEMSSSSTSSSSSSYTNKFQNSEVSKIEWKTYEDGINSIRTYNLEKKSVLSRVNKLLSDYRLYH